MVAEEVLAAEAGMAREQPAPGLEREERELGGAGVECDPSGQRGHARLAGHERAARREVGRALGPCPVLGARLADDGRRRDARPRSLPGLDQALGRQLVERRHHGVARDREPGGRAADRRKPRPRRHGAAQDQLAQLVAELAVER